MSKTDMVDIKQKRESQRQELIEGLIQVSYQEEDSLRDRTFYLKLASAIASYLKDRQKGITEPKTKTDKVGLFFASILIIMKHFAQTEVERDALIAEFLEKTVAIGTHPFQAALLSQEIHEPEKLFDAPSAMSEVP